MIRIVNKHLYNRYTKNQSTIHGYHVYIIFLTQQEWVIFGWIKIFIVSSGYQKLKDQYLKKWYNYINNSSKRIRYRIFKTTFVCEKYLNTLSIKFRNILVKFRTSNHRLPIEVGRWNNLKRHERICNLCNNNQIGDEFHYLLECYALAWIY